MPKTIDPNNPQPFRADSPFQQLVDTRIVHEDILSRYRGNVKETDEDAESDTKKVVCFITNWSFYRKKDGKFVPEMLDTKLCSHIIYSFGSLDPTTLTVKEFDRWADLENDLYRRTTNLPRNVPVLLAIGGWTDSSGDKYSQLVHNPSARRTFVRSLIPFLKKYGFRGVHFDWNYPKCWQSDCRKGKDSDRPNFTKFIQELSSELDRNSLLLSVGISGYKEIIQKAYGN